MNRLRSTFLITWTILLLSLTAPALAGDTVTVFAAISVKDALDEVGKAYEREKGIPVVSSYGASSTLAKQIENGAPADIFISADTDWMDYVATRKLIKPASRRNLLTNRLVLIAPISYTAAVEITRNFPLARLLGNERLAIADPETVPAGKYAKASLETLGIWKDVQAKIAPTENVRAALILVSRGEAPFGIVYRTDALADKKVRILGEFPSNTYPPIVYPVALTIESHAPAAAFLSYLFSPAARAVFEKYGF